MRKSTGAIRSDDDLVKTAWGTLVAAATDPPTHCPLASQSYALACLAHPDLGMLRNGRSERAMRLGARGLLEALDDAPTTIEEETFLRGNALDRWRHFVLPLALHAAATARPSAIADPLFRRHFATLCGLQQMEGVNRGGFALGPQGLVTTYATVQAMATVAAVDAAIETQPDPAELVEVLFRTEGRHHTDPQVLGGVGRWQAVANSPATLLGALIATAIAATAVLPLIVGDGASVSMRRLVVGLDIYVLALAWYGYAVARLPGVSRTVIASIMFAGVTAVLFPLLSLLI